VLQENFLRETVEPQGLRSGSDHIDKGLFR